MPQTKSYSQFLLTQDQGFIGRISSILKNEGFVKDGSSVNEAVSLAPDVAAEPGIADAYHGALIATPPRADAGIADDVITDGALLSAVTAVWNAQHPSDDIQQLPSA